MYTFTKLTGADRSRIYCTSSSFRWDGRPCFDISSERHVLIDDGEKDLVVAWKRTLIQRLEQADNDIVVRHIHDNRQWNQPTGPIMERLDNIDEALQFLHEVARYSHPDNQIYRFTNLTTRERITLDNKCSEILYWYGGQLQ